MANLIFFMQSESLISEKKERFARYIKEVPRKRAS